MEEIVPTDRRRDASDEIGTLLAPRPPGRGGAWSGVADDNPVINAVPGF